MCERAISGEKTVARAQARAHIEVNRDFNGQMCTPCGGGSILSYFVDQQNNMLCTHSHTHPGISIFVGTFINILHSQYYPTLTQMLT